MILEINKELTKVTTIIFYVNFFWFFFEFFDEFLKLKKTYFAADLTKMSFCKFKVQGR